MSVSRLVFIIASTALSAAMVACSIKVAPQDVVGTYEAKYPFGRSILVLQDNGTFTQRAEVAGEPLASSRGTWSFDESRSTLSLHGGLALDDGFGRLSREWKVAGDSPSLAVERVWLRITIEDSETYPHRKVE